MRFKYLFLIFFISSCGGGGSSSILVPDIEPPTSSYQAYDCQNYDGPTNKIIWIDDFTEVSYLDNWTAVIGNGAEYGIPGWGNNERQYYTDSVNNANVINGCLRITPLNESKEGFSYTSAKLITENKVDFNHPGKITVKFRSPEGVGMWPAIWMMPVESIFGGWPASGEIDLVEIRGDNMQEILSTVHYGSDPSSHKYQGGTYLLSQSNNLNEAFHELTFIWEENSMKFVLDDEHTVFEITSNQIGFDENYPFNEVFYLIINVAVGGNFVGNYVNNNDLCYLADAPICQDDKRFLIDWIKYETL
tara:strand:+ start:3663 stop:4574 length:912 start_codon:yes stop_codon:yes gene_type:complete